MEADTVKAIIEKKEDFLRRHVILSMSVIERLRQHDVIGEFTAKQIAGNQSNPDRQITLLLASLKTRGLAAFQGFLNVLRLTFHGWVADDVLDAKVELPDVKQTLPTVVQVRDVINKYQRDTLDKAEPCVKHVEEMERSHNYRHEVANVRHDMRHVLPIRNRNETAAGMGRQFTHPGSDQLYDKYFKDINGGGGGGNYSPVTQIPGNLRDLQRIFDIEASSVSKSIAVLKQEELTIKALLQQNLREQQDMLTKQEALTGIKDQMKLISNSATQLYKPDPDSNDSMSRLRRLQRTYWAMNSR